MTEPVKPATAGTMAGTLDETIVNTFSALNKELTKNILCPNRVNELTSTLKVLHELKSLQQLYKSP